MQLPMHLHLYFLNVISKHGAMPCVCNLQADSLYHEQKRDKKTCFVWINPMKYSSKQENICFIDAI